MSFVEHYRHKLSAAVLWCVFLVLYLGGTVLVVVGLVLAGRTWWALVQHHAGLWPVCTKSAELFVPAAVILLILIIPFVRHQTGGESPLCREERRSGMKAKRDSPVAE